MVTEKTYFQIIDNVLKEKVLPIDFLKYLSVGVERVQDVLQVEFCTAVLTLP